MKILSYSLQTISKTENLRMGLSFAKESHALFLKKYSKNCPLRLSEICIIEKGKVITEEDSSDGIIPVVAGGKTLAYYHNKYNREKDVITISASGAYSGFVNYWNTPIWASDCITVRSKDENTYITLFIYHLLRIIQQDIYLLQKGADQPHVYPTDIKRIFIPEIDIGTQHVVLDKIQLIEREIQELQSSIQNMQIIINKTFEKEFLFNSSIFEELKCKRVFWINGIKSINNPDLRFSAKFHRDAGSFVMKQLTDITDKKIKHYLAEPIVLGASISPGDYSEYGEYQYISMATIKNWMFDSESANYVSKEYSDSKAAKTVRKNDIILARSGEGTIGKVALIDDDNINGVFADFTMRIRLKDYNPEFAYYYFRTSYFQYLIEVFKKGLGNNTNIFPVVIQEFPLIDISLDEQQRIVDEIHSEIAKQEDIKKQIADLRNQIDCIIEEAITKGDE